MLRCGERASPASAFGRAVFRMNRTIGAKWRNRPAHAPVPSALPVRKRLLSAALTALFVSLPGGDKDRVTHIKPKRQTMRRPELTRDDPNDSPSSSRRFSRRAPALFVTSAAQATPPKTALRRIT